MAPSCCVLTGGSSRDGGLRAGGADCRRLCAPCLPLLPLRGGPLGPRLRPSTQPLRCRAVPTFGVHTGMQNTTVDELRDLWRRAEDGGFDAISVWDHIYSSDLRSYDCHEAVAMHTALACATSRARCGCLVYCAGYRHPGVLAKAVATIDHLSAGRAEIGLDPRDVQLAVNVAFCDDDASLAAQFGPRAEAIGPGAVVGTSVDQAVDALGRYLDAGADQVHVALRAPWDHDALDRAAVAVAAVR